MEEQQPDRGQYELFCGFLRCTKCGAGMGVCKCWDKKTEGPGYFAGKFGRLPPLPILNLYSGLRTVADAHKATMNQPKLELEGDPFAEKGEVKFIVHVTFEMVMKRG